MNSKEIIGRTLAFDRPERIGHSFAPSDFASSGHSEKGRATEWKKIDEKEGRWQRLDLWGNVWERVDDTSCGEVVRGALESWDDLDNFAIPDFSSPALYQNVRDMVRNNPDKWTIGGLPGFTFSVARKIRKLEYYLEDLLLEPDKIRVLHDRIDQALTDIIRNHAAAGVDSVFFAEDWGTQIQTFISPALWREEFFPRFRKHCALAHDLGLKVFMHSCGQISAIVPGLIEAGIDVLQFDQPRLHGFDRLASYQEKAKITFWCPVDIQRTLQTKDADIIRAEVREALEKLWKGRGGFIAGYYGDNASIGLELKWQQIAADAYLEWGHASFYDAKTGCRR